MNGKIFIVGTGPGSYEQMTLEAINAIKESNIIIGYTVYTDLLKPYFPDKEFASTPMTKEIERCRLCFDYALKGKIVSLVCSGDAGVYGIASPMFQLLHVEKQYKDIELKIIAGVTAASSGAAVLGAPLNHDFCVISLSNLMTPWNVIEKRISCAIKGDFAIALYNPSSHKRKDYLKKACQIMLDSGADKNRSCGFVENIGREETKVQACTLGELLEKEVNMFTTVFIGNSQSEIFITENNVPVLLTKRGYTI